jgi:hypothetical protein
METPTADLRSVGEWSVPAPIVAGIAWLIGGWAVVYLIGDALPDRYFFDHLTLLDMVHRPYIDGGGSFGATALLYRSMYPFGVPNRVLVGFVNHTIVVALLVGCMMASSGARRAGDYVWLTTWCLIAAIFVGMLSKEVFTITVSAIVVLALARGGRVGWLVAAGVIFLYGLGVRTYWVAVMMYTGTIFIVAASRKTIPGTVAAFLLVLLLGSTAVHLMTGVYLTDARIVMNIVRLDSPNVASMVLNPLPNSSVVTDVFNHLWAWGNFLLPVKPLVSGVPQQMGFAVWQMANVVIVIGALKRARSWMPRPTLYALTSFILGLTLVLAAFDGDFGSYARHQIALIPVVGFILGGNTPVEEHEATTLQP